MGQQTLAEEVGNAERVHSGVTSKGSCALIAQMSSGAVIIRQRKDKKLERI
ncbi:hypothetical protein KIN20_027713 [Parelaphostrongylus tenuis]|uniref:Uncharacterized protein n=1 Tax=Parelaphostrongylus tenuis TaxID=148309 RepID=A0AAD5QZQ4_PARTN|nr:hypothetical protein KIN20_027713 [Parelaphostrongylus tenuis]